MSRDLRGRPLAERAVRHIVVSTIFENPGEVTNEVLDAPQRATGHYRRQLLRVKTSNQCDDPFVRPLVGRCVFFDGGHCANVLEGPDVFNGA
jgi:hypothetical protein